MRDISIAPERTLFFRFKRAHHLLYVYASRKVAEATGALSAQVAAVVHLARRDRVTVRELGDELGLNSAGITGLVTRLERDGLARRAPSATDRRALSVQLTPHGRKLAARVAPLLVAMSARMTEGFTSQEVAIVERFLDHLTTSFTAAPASAARRSRATVTPRRANGRNQRPTR
jgi:DNA-binding MarR family transcriptional regulator